MSQQILGRMQKGGKREISSSAWTRLCYRSPAIAILASIYFILFHRSLSPDSKKRFNHVHTVVYSVQFVDGAVE